MPEVDISKKIIEFARWKEANPLKQWRKRKRIQKQLIAQLLGVSEVTVGNWESGRKRPAPDKIRSLTKLHPTIPRTWEEWEAQRPRPL